MLLPVVLFSLASVPNLSGEPVFAARVVQSSTVEPLRRPNFSFAATGAAALLARQ